MRLAVLCVCQRSHTLVLVLLMLCSVVPEVRNNCSDESLHLSKVLEVIEGCCGVLDSQAHGPSCRELRYELRSVIDQWICRYTVWNRSMVDEYGRRAHRCICSDRSGPCLLCISVCQNNFMIIAEFHFCSLTHNVHCQKFEQSGCWIQT